MTQKKLSIIIPCHNEANNLPLLISDLKTFPGPCEICVVDSNSTDLSFLTIVLSGSKYINTKEGNRGIQLSKGAEKTSGDWLLFIHADSRLPEDWSKHVLKLINSEATKNTIWYFKFKVLRKGILFSFLQMSVNIRCLFLNTPYGDQGILVHKDAYKFLNGFNNLPIMEDIDFIERAKNNNYKIKSIGGSIYINTRRWHKKNIFKKAIENAILRRLWKSGKNPKELYNRYYKN